MVRLFRAQSKLPLVGVTLLAGVTRLYWGLQPRIVWGDEPFYLWLGQNLLDGQGYQFFGISAVHHSPLFALLAVLLGRLIALPAGLPAGSAEALATGSVAVCVLAGALLVWPIYGLGRRTAGERAGLAAALATAVYPALVVSPLLWGTMTEPIYVLLIATGWWGLLVAMESVGHEDTKRPEEHEARTRGLHFRQTRGLGGYALAGAAFALAYLTRSEAIVFLVAGLGAVLLLRLTMGRPIPWQRTLAGTALALVIFCGLISPYLFVLHERTGKWQLLEEAGSTYVSAQGLAYGNTAAFDVATWGLDPASGEVYYFSTTSEGQGLIEAIIANPVEFGRRLRANLKELVSSLTGPQLLGWPLLSLALLGLFHQPWDARRLRGELLLAVSLAGPFSFVLFFVQDRYLATALIPALVWIGGGVAWLGEWLAGTIADCRSPIADCGMRIADCRLQIAETQHAPRTTQHAPRTTQHAPRTTQHAPRTTQHAPRILRCLPAILFALALLWQQPRLWDALHQTHSFQPGHTTAATMLRVLGAPADAVVLSRYPAVAFHAGTAWAPTPAAAWEDVLTYARKRQARYLVVDEWETRLRPALRPLLDPSQAPPELRYLTTVDESAGPVVIYEFVGKGS